MSEIDGTADFTGLDAADESSSKSATRANSIKAPESKEDLVVGAARAESIESEDARDAAVDTVVAHNASTVARDTDEEDLSHVSLLFRDGLDLPIVGLEFLVTLPSGLVCSATSTNQGAITLPVANDRSGEARVEVKDETGKSQSVCTIDLARCKNAVIVRSQKVKADVSPRPHQQTPPPPQKEEKTNQSASQKIDS